MGTEKDSALKTSVDGIRLVPDVARFASFRRHFADCVIVTAAGKLLLQKHLGDCPKLPNAIHPFGGHVEARETPVEAMIREVAEETGGTVNEEMAIYLGAVTEEDTGYQDLVHVWYWHDRENTVTECYEREAVEFDSAADALGSPDLMAYARWALQVCVDRGFLSGPDDDDPNLMGREKPCGGERVI